MKRGRIRIGVIRIGVGGWTYADWRGRFFPAGLPHAWELAYAASRLTAIEVNGTFYRTQTPATFARWRAETPQGFVLGLKAPRYATNRSDLGGAGASIARFLDSGPTALGDRLGPINWQLPPTRRFDAAGMEAFLSLLPPDHAGVPLRHAVEARHPSFDDPAFAEICRRHGVAIVEARDGPYPLIAAETAGFGYLRLMGTRDGEPLGYAARELDALAARLTHAADRGRDLFCYVIGGHKAANPDAAMALIERVGQAASVSSPASSSSEAIVRAG